MMNPKEYLYNNLQKLSDQFGVTFDYQFNADSAMHVIAVSPVELYDDRLYGEAEYAVTREFDKLFLPESLLFVASNDILVKVNNPEFIIKPAVVFVPLKMIPATWNSNHEGTPFLTHENNYALAA